MLLLMLFLSLLAPLVAAQAAPLFLDPSTLDRLAAREEIEGSLTGGLAPQLVPQVPERAGIVAAIRQADFTTGVELLRLYQGAEDFSTPEARLKIYNILRSISTMSGMQYYSASRKRMRTLFAQSYVVEGPDDQVAVPDPVAESIPADSSLVIFQEDLTFGKNLYRSQYRCGHGHFVVETRNLTVMRYLLLPMVQPGDSLSILIVIPEGNRILFYGATGAHTLRFFGLERSKEDSSYNRLQALYGWFTRRLAETF